MMKGLVIHWTNPWEDIYSGLDPTASAWISLAKSHELELLVIERNWPFPNEAQGYFNTFDEVLDHKPESDFILADLKCNVMDADVISADYLVMGPPEGWRNTHNDIPRWSYPPTPNGGYHALLLAHLAVGKLMG